MTASDRFVCVHGHFYQPPRENPWLEAVEPEDSAYPYHDWNVRITEECYGPNSASRILGERGAIEAIVNNYAHMSFNFGPTLLGWLETEAPDVYRKVVDADGESMERFSGHGSAMAQAYNHMILPLATERDKRTQIRWGIADFVHRFQRPPEGMWLPETAVDGETLALLAEAGIGFTVLAPSQAGRIRGADGTWQNVEGEGIDTRRAYASVTPAGAGPALFFYDGAASRAVAFERLLDNGETFARRLLAPLEGAPPGSLSHIATDGETYGHHHRFGDMALAFALKRVADGTEAHLTNYAEYLALHPPREAVEVRDRTSWSCAHGVGRWEDDCGCHIGGRPGWNQKWRRHLRDALDFLRDATAGPFEETAGRLLRDPWAARDGYIDVILDRSPQSVERFLERFGRPGAGDEVSTVLKLMELERHALLMYTSCGFFFDDLAGIETIQILRYAARVVQLARELFGTEIEPAFLERLARAESNVRGEGDGASIYRRRVRPSMVDLETVAGHYAVVSLFRDRPSRIYCYTTESLDAGFDTSGTVKLALGNVRIASEVTREAGTFTYGALHFGDHHVSAGVRPAPSGDGVLPEVRRRAVEAFDRADLVEVVRIFGQQFPHVTTSLRYLFRDEQQRILEEIAAAAADEADAAYRRVYQRHAPLLKFLADVDIPLPPALGAGLRVTLIRGLRRALAAPSADPDAVEDIMEEAERFHVPLDDQGVAYAFEGALERLARGLGADVSGASMHRLTRLLGLAERLPVEVLLWKTQNAVFAMKDRLPSATNGAEGGRIGDFRELARTLGLEVDA